MFLLDNDPEVPIVVVHEHQNPKRSGEWRWVSTCLSLTRKQSTNLTVCNLNLPGGAESQIHSHDDDDESDYVNCIGCGAAADDYEDVADQ